IARQPVEVDRASREEVWKLIRAGDAGNGPRRIDAGYGVTQIEVVYERCPDQRLQLLVFEDIEPRQIGEGRRLIGSNQIGCAEVGWRVHSGPLVMRPNGTACEKNSWNQEPTFHALLPSSRSPAGLNRSVVALGCSAPASLFTT